MILTTLNRNGGVDGWLLPTTNRIYKGPFTVLVIHYSPNYVFDVEHAQSLNGKPVIILEVSEFGVNHSWQNAYMPGVTIQDHRQVESIAEYLKLDEWIKRQRVVCCFKREYTPNITTLVLNGAVTYPVYPIEIFFDNIPQPPIPDRDEYLSRIGMIYHVFGNSHPSRKELAGEMMKRFERIVTSIPKIVGCVNHKLPFHVVEQVEAIDRYDLHSVLHHQGLCQLSVNLPGYGVKNFRGPEACFNAVPVMADLGLKYAVPWDDSNSVQLPTENGRIKVEESIHILENIMRDQESLWQKMLGAYQAALRLRPDFYVEEFINKPIRSHL